MYKEKERDPIVVLLLYFVTCGLYSLYWVVTTQDQMNRARKDLSGMSGLMVLLLSIVTCGLFSVYWWYKISEELNDLKETHGLPTNNNGFIYVILVIFGFNFINMMIMQNELNEVWTKIN